MKSHKKVAFSVLIYVGLPTAILGLITHIVDKHSHRLEPISRYMMPVYEFENPTEFDSSSMEASPSTRTVFISDTFKASELKRKLKVEEDPNLIPLGFHSNRLSADNVLKDVDQRISEEFKVPDDLRDRVKFWFDIYTRYSGRFSVVHDIHRPWIIYEIIDARSIYETEASHVTKSANERILIHRTLSKTRLLLKSLAQRKNLKNLTLEESRYLSLLESIPGKRKKVLAEAAKNVRTQRGQKNFFRQGIILGSKYIQEMEDIFQSFGMPTELVRLPFVESSFNDRALSKVGASGIWQFMPDTGRKFLKVNHLIDERHSPLKATEAAAKLLKSNFKILGTWPLAITAYNHGPGGLIRAQKKLKTTSLAEMISKYDSRSFGFASENFYCEFLAALHAEKYHEEIFGPMDKFSPIESEAIDLRFNVSLQQLSEITGISDEEIRYFNPELKVSTVTPKTLLPRGFHLRLPSGRKTRLELFYKQDAEARHTIDRMKGTFGIKESLPRKTAGASRNQVGG
ncbi:MAG: lytic transglycosylase domain-containing protein [Oligoflexia bacterium]|nr:lytic transglycosylase domain-containing protein [Oligoflexia bacterium]